MSKQRCQHFGVVIIFLKFDMLAFILKSLFSIIFHTLPLSFTLDWGGGGVARIAEGKGFTNYST